MSTSSTSASSLMSSLSEFARLMSEQHYHFLSQSLDNLERQVERHRAEQHFMKLNITNFRQQTTRRHHYHYTEPTTTSFSGSTPSPLPHIEIQPRRRSFNEATDVGSKENPIYVFDDDEIRCEGCWEEGHFIGDCNREYRYDGRRYVPIPEGGNSMEPTYIVDRDYYQSDSTRLQAESGKSTTLIHH